MRNHLNRHTARFLIGSSSMCAVPDHGRFSGMKLQTGTTYYPYATVEMIDAIDAMITQNPAKVLYPFSRFIASTRNRRTIRIASV